MRDSFSAMAGGGANAEPDWYVVHTQPNRERQAAECIARQGFTVYLPRYLKKRRHARRVDVVDMPFFPRYLFVAIDVSKQRWRDINSTFGVSRIVASGGEIRPVMRGVVEAIKAREGADGYLHVLAPVTLLKAGAPLRVVSGVFDGCSGLFEALNDHDRVAMLLDLLGRKVRVTIDSNIVEAV